MIRESIKILIDSQVNGQTLLPASLEQKAITFDNSLIED